MLKKILITLLVLAVIGGIIALVHHIRVAHRNKKELANFAEEIPYTANLGRVLVIYYSWTGHTQDIAEQIAALTKGDTYRIQTQEEFKSSPAFYARVKKELNNKIYPGGHLLSAGKLYCIYQTNTKEVLQCSIRTFGAIIKAALLPKLKSQMFSSVLMRKNWAFRQMCKRDLLNIPGMKVCSFTHLFTAMLLWLVSS